MASGVPICSRTMIAHGLNPFLLHIAAKVDSLHAMLGPPRAAAIEKVVTVAAAAEPADRNILVNQRVHRSLAQYFYHPLPGRRSRHIVHQSLQIDRQAQVKYSSSSYAAFHVASLSLPRLTNSVCMRSAVILSGFSFCFRNATVSFGRSAIFNNARAATASVFQVAPPRFEIDFRLRRLCGSLQWLGGVGRCLRANRSIWRFELFGIGLGGAACATRRSSVLSLPLSSWAASAAGAARLPRGLAPRSIVRRATGGRA